MYQVKQSCMHSMASLGPPLPTVCTILPPGVRLSEGNVTLHSVAIMGIYDVMFCSQEERESDTRCT